MNLPNKLTMARVICVPIFAVLYYLDLNIWACIVFIIASITDMLDGRITRSRNMVTNFGKIMDPLADKVLVYAAFCLFIEKDVMPGWMLIIILARE
ncbi:MAG: CDP-alcohol phosphatidyltransferase family protein, partial [Firmicutes bacterium]|nr:CDP-alcohol phosphatidyltransferase family protein [Bacillota bacterium]